MKKPTIVFITLSIILAVATFLRLYQFEGFVTFLGDQGRDAIIVRDIVTFAHLPAIGAPTSVGQVYLGPFYYYLIAPFLLLFNFNPVGLAYGVAIFSLISIIYAFWIIKNETTSETALLFLALLTFSSVLIELSRFSWNPNLLPYFTFFSFYFFYKWLDDNSWLYAALWGAFLSFSLQLHYLVIFSFIPIVIFFIYSFIKSKYKKRYLLTSLVGFFSFAFFTSPLIIFDLRHDFLNFNNFMKLFQEGGVDGNAPYVSKLFETIHEFMQNALQIEISVYVAILMFVSILITAWWIYKQTKNTFFLLNILNTFFFVAGFALLTSFRHAHYFGPAYLSFYLILASIPFIIKQTYVRYTVIAILLAIFVFHQSQDYYYLRQNPNNQISKAKETAAFLSSKIGNKPYNISTWPVEFTEDPIVYFLELSGKKPADRKKIEITKQMFVICEKDPCLVIDSPSWNISMFGPAEIEDQWEHNGYKIFKLVHAPEQTD